MAREHGRVATAPDAGAARECVSGVGDARDARDATDGATAQVFGSVTPRWPWYFPPRSR